MRTRKLLESKGHFDLTSYSTPGPIQHSFWYILTSVNICDLKEREKIKDEAQKSAEVIWVRGGLATEQYMSASVGRRRPEGSLVSWHYRFLVPLCVKAASKQLGVQGCEILA